MIIHIVIIIPVPIAPTAALDAPVLSVVGVFNNPTNIIIKVNAMTTLKVINKPRAIFPAILLCGTYIV